MHALTQEGELIAFYNHSIRRCIILDRAEIPELMRSVVPKMPPLSLPMPPLSPTLPPLSTEEVPLEMLGRNLEETPEVCGANAPTSFPQGSAPPDRTPRYALFMLVEKGDPIRLARSNTRERLAEVVQQIGKMLEEQEFSPYARINISDYIPPESAIDRDGRAGVTLDGLAGIALDGINRCSTRPAYQHQAAYKDNRKGDVHV